MDPSTGSHLAAKETQGIERSAPSHAAGSTRAQFFPQFQCCLCFCNPAILEASYLVCASCYQKLFGLIHDLQCVLLKVPIENMWTNNDVMHYSKITNVIDGAKPEK